MASQKIVDLIIGIILSVISILGIIYAKDFSGGAKLAPLITLTGLLIFNLCLIISSLIKKEDSKNHYTNWKSWLKIVILTLLYISSMKLIGFYISSTLFIFLTMYIFGIRKIKILIFLPVFFVISIYFIFTLGLKIYFQ